MKINIWYISNINIGKIVHILTICSFRKMNTLFLFIYLFFLGWHFKYKRKFYPHNRQIPWLFVWWSNHIITLLFVFFLVNLIILRIIKKKKLCPRIRRKLMFFLCGIGKNKAFSRNSARLWIHDRWHTHLLLNLMSARYWMQLWKYKIG